MIAFGYGVTGAEMALARTGVKTSAYTASPGDLVPCDISGGAFTVKLPSAPADGARVAVKVIATAPASQYVLTVACQGLDVLNKSGGTTSATLTLPSQGAIFLYQASTAIWTVTSDDLPLGSVKTTIPDWFNVRLYGAKGDGVTNDRAAIQAADAAAAAVNGGVVFFPAGTYLVSFALQPAREPSGSTAQPWRRRWTGSGAVITGSSGILNFSGPTVASSLEVDHLTLVSNGGSVFNHLNVFQWSFHDLVIVQNDATSPIIDGNDGHFTNLQYTVFRDVTAWAVSSSRTRPLVDVLSASNDAFSSVLFEHWHLAYSDGTTAATTHPMIRMETTSGIHQNIAFRDCRWGSPTGGAITSLSGENIVIEACQVWDLFEEGASASTYYAGKSGSNTRASKNIAVRDCQRSLGGVDGSTAWDVECESTTLGLTVSNYSAASDTTHVNLHGALSAVLVNNQAGITVSNPASDTVMIGGSPLSPGWTAPDLGLAAMAWDSGVATPTARSVTGGVLTLVGLIIRAPVTVSTIRLVLSTNGSSLTSSENFVGLYSSSGAQLGFSADQTTAWGSGAPKVVDAALTATSAGTLTLQPGLVWVAILANGTTPPQFGGGSNLAATFLNGQLTAAKARQATSGSGLTALPASITPASNALSQTAVWAAVL